jgi:hypothetical protein
MSTRSYSKKQQRNKFCGVCHKAGRPESEYTSHYTKSDPGPNGKVTCPLILNNECNYCFQIGHFKSACPALAANSRDEKKRAYQERREHYKVLAAEPKCCKKVENNNRYAALFDSDEHSDEEVTLKPTCVKRKHRESVGPKPVDVKPSTWNKPSFADMLKREEPLFPAKPTTPVMTGYTIITKGSIVPPVTEEAASAIATENYDEQYDEQYDDEYDEEYHEWGAPPAISYNNRDDEW